MTTTYSIPLSVEELMAKARDIADVDLPDQEVVEPLTVLVESLNSESQLHEKGALAMQDKLLRMLANRLRMKRDFVAHPEIAEQKIEAPIILCGMPRTGSTKSQKLFSMSGDFNFLPLWKAFNFASFSGRSNEDVQPRIDEALEFERFIEEGSPQAKTGHQFLAMEPEEESFVLEQSFISPIFLGWSPVKSYLRWMLKQDLSYQFEFLRDAMKYMQWQGVADGAKRWLLKCPLYAGLEPLLLKVFPDACLVMTHRTPVSTIPSSTRLLELFYKPYCEGSVAIKNQISGSAASIGGHLANRKANPAMNILDVDYRDLINDVEGVIRKVYDFAKVELGDASLQRMLDWNASNPKHKHGKFEYSLDDYGCTQAEIETVFKDYIRFIDNGFAA